MLPVLGGSRVKILFGRVFGDGFHFKHVHDRKELGEKQEQGEEQAQGSHIDADVNPRGGEHHPTGGQEVAVQGGYDDHEPLKPHPDVHEDGDQAGQ